MPWHQITTGHQQTQTYAYLTEAACYSYGPDSKVHGANMGPIWGRRDSGGPHVGPMNFVIWGITQYISH